MSLANLGTRPVANALVPSRREADLAALQHDLKVTFPADYAGFLLEHGGAAVPSELAIVVSQSPLYGEESTDPEDFQAYVETLFGLGTGDDSLREAWGTYEGRMPTGVFPIAASAGGNLLCMDTRQDTFGFVLYWDHELELEEHELPVVSSSFTEFLERITVAPKSESKTTGIVSSRLNF